MAISIDWGTRVILVPKSDTSLVQSSPTEVRQLDMDWFRLQLKALEDDQEGMPFPDTHRHTTETTIAGITFARVIEIINGYTVTFEDGQYVVKLKGANNNILENLNSNQVSIQNEASAGLINNYSQEELAAAVFAFLVETNFTFLQAQRIVLAAQGGKVSGAATAQVKVRDVNDTKDRITADVDEYGNRTNVTLDASD